MALLEIQKVRQCFGGLVALNNVSFTISKGQIAAAIGPNGAGKTTLFNIVSGMQHPTDGVVHFSGRAITGLAPYQVARLGISRTFQNLSLFERMTVIENVMIGRHTRSRAGAVACALRLPTQRRGEREIRDAAMEGLEYIGLASLADVPVASLSFGQRRMVELARALATEPTLLLLDEPASGLNTKETDDLARLICRMRDRGITAFLVEHDMSLVMDISDEILVLHYGETIARGSPQSVRNDPRVIEVYLVGEFNGAKD